MKVLRYAGLIPIMAIVFLFTCTYAASAENPDKGAYVNLFFGKFHPDHDLKYDSSSIAGLGLGYNFTKNLAAELSFAQMNTDEDGTGVDEDAFIRLYRLEALYYLTDSSTFVPYIAAGPVAMRLNSDATGNETDFGADYGLGLKYIVNPSVDLRADVRHVITFNEDVDTCNSLLYTLGFNFRFGCAAKAAAAPVKETPATTAAPVEADSDRDGVLDRNDACPGTPSGVAVDAKGCPKDSDGDGIADSLDKCPQTPKGAKVDASGCPLDADGDGVADYLDKCPDTPKGTKVEANGCPAPKAEITKQGTYNFGNIYFDTSKATIKQESYPVLQGVITYMNGNPEAKLEIQGYTDSLGSRASNQKLSENRANAVRDYLIGKGIAADRLTAKGYGVSNPAATNATKDGRAKNRRIEFKPI